MDAQSELQSLASRASKATDSAKGTKHDNPQPRHQLGRELALYCLQLFDFISVSTKTDSTTSNTIEN